LEFNFNQKFFTSNWQIINFMKTKLFIIITLLSITSVFSQQVGLNHESVQSGRNIGFGIGSSLAIVLSWSKNKSILWAILHGLLSWIYVIYFAVSRKD